MKQKLRVLMTGHTGFLGQFVKPLLSEIAEVTCISRSDPKSLQGDLSFWDGRIDPQSLKGKFDVFLHMAGLYNLRVSLLESLRQNVMTTHTALAIAQKSEIPHFVHISTVAVTVRHKELIVGPGDLDIRVAYPDYYSYAKAHCEGMVRNWIGGFKSKTVLRLGILVGDRKNGKIRRVDGPYHAATVFKKNAGLIAKWPGPIPVPGNSRSRLPLVPVDCAADAIVKVIEISRKKNWEGHKVFHFSPRNGLTAENLYRSTLTHLGMSHKDIALMNILPDAFTKRAAEFLTHLPKEEVEYLLNLPKLDTSDTRKILGDEWCPEFEEYEAAFWKGFETYVSNS